MLKPKQMCRLTIAGPKTVIEPTIETLYRLRLLHIEDYTNVEEGFDIGAPLEKSGKISEVLIRLRSLKSCLSSIGSTKDRGCDEKREKYVKTEQISDVKDKVIKLDEEVLEKIEKIKEMNDEYTRLNAFENTLEELSVLPLKPDDYTNYASLKMFVGHVNRMPDKDIDKITDKYELYSGKSKDGYVIALFVHRSKEGEMLEVLNQCNYSEIDVSEVSSIDGNFADEIDKIRKRKDAINQRVGKLNHDLGKLSSRWSSYLEENEKRLSWDSEKAEAPLRFATTKNAFIVRGWIPSDTYEMVRNRLDEDSGGMLYMEMCEKEEDGAPIALDNPAVVKPFEFFMNLYSLPKYNEIDPTFFMFLSFPLLFGFMLGDIGYGIVTLVLFSLLRMKIKQRALLDVMIMCSLVTILFGVLYGEFFGEEAMFGIELHPMLHRAAEIQQLLMISVVIGIFHVNMGFLLGFFNELKSHGFKEALFKKGSWMLIEVGAAVFALSYLHYINLSWMVGAGIIAISLVMLVMGEGALGLIELPSLLSHTLSYSRLMAIGLASVYLAMIVNEYAGLCFSNGGIYVVLAAGILLGGHAINIALGILGPFLQSMRLHYVEFFTKFYKGEGKQYTPFGRDIGQ